MQRIRVITVLTCLMGGFILSGCGKEQRPQIDPSAEKPPEPEHKKAHAIPSGQTTGTFVPADRPGATPAGSGAGEQWTALSVPAPDLSPQEKYDAALLEALNLLIDRKYPQALTALENARAVQDTEQIRQQIERVKTLMDQQAAADRTAQNIQTVLDSGKSEEAARLATASLQQYGGTDDAERLAKLKLQAEALTAAQVDDQAAQRGRLRQEAETALRDKNLRAAAIAYEQALQYGDDADLRRQLEGVRATLTRYDDCRRRAAELRRDPANLEDALAALNDAAQAWDTLQVHQEIDEYTLALQKRRDRLSVADFEVRGDVGLPMAGRTVAEELLPAFKVRFDLVERGQLNKVIDELKLEASELSANEAGRQEVGRLAKVRYLVLGSLTVTSGITVNARLVDVRSGLIVQTARLVAVSPTDLMAQLPQLANLLMMTDEQKMAYEQQLAQRAVAAPPVVVVAPLPPPPVVVVSQPPPPPVIVFTTRPPELGGLQPQDFDAPPPPTTSVQVVVERDDPVKQRTVQVAVALGDNLFRRGKYQEANTQFELALSLSPHHRELSLRIESCRPHLPPPPPPPPVVVVQPTAPPVVVVPVVRPRVAVLNFVVNADPGRVPPAFGDWAAEQVASYFTPAYEVVERGEVCWYMGRLGITMRDVLVNPSARVCLGRALNVRFFVFGAIQQTASFDVSTHVIDAESGNKQGGGKIHVQDHQELKLRAGELVQQTQANPVEANRLQQEAKEQEKVLTEARKLFQAGQYPQTLSVCQEGLKRFPNHAGLQTLKQQAEQKIQQAALEQKRKQELAAQQAQAAALQKQQHELALQAEAARKQAEQAAAARTAAQRKAQEAQRQKAYDDLYAGGHRAFQQGNYAQAIQMLQSAVALKQTDVAVRELAQARAKADEGARAKAAADKAQHDAEVKRQQDTELARVRAQVEEERKKREAEELARRKAQEAHDQAAYAKLLDDGKRLLGQGQFDAAAANFQSARQLRPTSEVNQLLAQVQEKRAQAEAQKKGAQAKADLERRQAEEARKQQQAAAEDAQRKKAEEQQRTAEFQRLMKEGNTALAAKQFDAAIKSFTQATKTLPGNAEATTALSRAEQARDQNSVQVRRQQEEAQKAQAAAAQQAAAQAEAKRKADTFQKWMTDGRQALAAKRYDAAIQAFREAQKLQPADPGGAAALREAEAAKQAAGATPAPGQQQVAAQAEAARKKKQEEDQRAAQVKQLLTAGRNALNARQFDAAAKAFTDASKLAPTDPAVVKALQDLDQARRAAVAEADLKNRQANYQAAMNAGRQALTAKRFDDAVRSFTDAAKLQPGDPAAAAMLKEVDKARKAEYARLMAQGKAAMNAKKYDDAVKAYTEALKALPSDAAATSALKEANQALQGSKSPPKK
jgi:tetratricopeptide (TPR) repeat protein